MTRRFTFGKVFRPVLTIFTRRIIFVAKVCVCFSFAVDIFDNTNISAVKMSLSPVLSVSQILFEKNLHLEVFFELFW